MVPDLGPLVQCQTIKDKKIDFILAELNGAAPGENSSDNDIGNFLRELEPQGYRFISSYIDGYAETLPLYLIYNALFMRVDLQGNRQGAT